MSGVSDIRLLNELLSEAKQTEELFESAARAIHDSPELKLRFTDAAKRRDKFVKLIAKQIYNMGGLPVAHDSWSSFWRKAQLFVDRVLIQPNSPYVLQACLNADEGFSKELLAVMNPERPGMYGDRVEKLVGLYYYTVSKEIKQLREELTHFTWGHA